jgi:hypothetical protein
MSDQQQRYAAIVAALINEPGVTQSLKKGFAQYGLKVEDKLFASLIRRGDALILKLHRARVDWLADSGDGERLDMGHGKTMREWVIVHADSAIDWLDLAREALVFVRQAPAPARRR